MYERPGLGWSEAPWYTRARNLWTCASGAMLTCVTDSPADREWRTQPVYVGGPQRCQAVREALMPTTCTTESGVPGHLHCCHRTALTPEAYAYMEQREELDLGPGQRVCEVQRFDRALLRNEAQRATWDIQDKLCQLRIDPGAVSGNPADRSLGAAIESFQRQRGLPTTGQVDAVTARAMGFSTADATRIASAVMRTSVGTEPGTETMARFSTPVVVASLGAAAFLAFATYSYVKR